MKKWGYRSSSTASEWLSVHQFTDAESCFKELKSKYGKIYTTHLSEESVEIYDIDLTASIALVFGNETFGVSETTRQYSDGNFIIPQVGVIKSLNISVACAITLYEAFRQKKEKGHYLQSRIEQSELEALKKQWNLINPNTN